MPIYEYRCAACGHALEALQKLSDAPLQDCPACKAPQLQKQISAAGFRLKGGGWYETDFKSGSKKNVAEGSSGAADGGSSSVAAAPASTTPSTSSAPSTPSAAT
jgi:putative FmdB family regulatory protein